MSYVEIVLTSSCEIPPMFLSAHGLWSDGMSETPLHRGTTVERSRKDAQDTESNDHSSEGSEIVHRKISLTRRIDQFLQETAATYYGDNCSQCVRIALLDHKRTLDGAGEKRLQEMATLIEGLREDINELQEAMEKIISGSKPHPGEGGAGAKPTDTVGIAPDHNPMSDEMYWVDKMITEAYPDSWSVDEFVAAGDLSKTEVQHALIDLNAREKITSSRIDGTVRYTATIDDSE